MAYIYKITNKINGKVYIGKTIHSIETRWNQHIYESQKQRYECRPLYDAFNKYGIENFTIEEIDRCSANDASDYEIYWIKKYRSYIGFKDCNGYNATLGGDGKTKCDYKWIIELWKTGLTNTEIQDITKYDYGTIRTALDEYGITFEERTKRRFEPLSKKVQQIDKKTGEIINTFNSCNEAQRLTGISHIKEASNPNDTSRKSAGGYIWRRI